MSINFIPARRFLDPGERIDYEGLDQLAGRGRAIVEPDTVGANEWITQNIIDAIELLDTETFSGFITATDTASIDAGESALLESYLDDLAGLNSVDNIVTCDQRDENFYYTAYVEQVESGLGELIFRIRFVAKNMSALTHALATPLIRFSVFAGVKAVQPRTPNAELVLQPGQVWIDPVTRLPFEPNIPVTAETMNASALPALSVRDHSITEVELNSEDVATFGSLYTGVRAVFILDDDVSVPVGPAILLGSITVIGQAGPNIIVSANRATPLFTAYVTASNGTTTISIYARNNYFTTLLLPLGQVINIFAY